MEVALYNYVNRSIVVLLFFKLAFGLKRVEFQINQKYDDLEFIITQLKR